MLSIIALIISTIALIINITIFVKIKKSYSQMAGDNSIQIQIKGQEEDGEQT